MKKTAILFFVLLFLLPAIGWGDEIKLIKGKGVEVCEAYKKNFNSFKSNWLMDEHRKINPEFKDFSKPNWKRLMEAIDRIKIGDKFVSELFIDRIDKFLWERDVNPAKYFRGGASKWRGTKKQLQSAWERFGFVRNELGSVPRDHLIANIDIDNDGTPEPVYLDHLYPYDGSLLLVLKPDYSDIDYEKTKLVMMHPSRKDLRLKDVRDISPEERKKRPELKYWTKSTTGDALNGLFYDVFIYKNKTYFDLWGLADSGFYGTFDNVEGRLRVFFSEKGKTTEICTLTAK